MTFTDEFLNGFSVGLLVGAAAFVWLLLHYEFKSSRHWVGVEQVKRKAVEDALVSRALKILDAGLFDLEARLTADRGRELHQGGDENENGRV